MSKAEPAPASLWHSLLDGEHRGRLAFVVTVLTLLVGGGWTLYTHLSGSAPKPADTRPNVTADHGGVAIGGNVTNSSIVGGGSPAPPKP